MFAIVLALWDILWIDAILRLIGYMISVTWLKNETTDILSGIKYRCLGLIDALGWSIFLAIVIGMSLSPIFIAIWFVSKLVLEAFYVNESKAKFFGILPVLIIIFSLACFLILRPQKQA